jgi:phosphoribosylformylglycinamidine synthase
LKEELTTLQTAQDLGLLEEEFNRIKEILGRTPNFTELSIFAVMWSEHCSYKNSIVWLKKLPKSSERMLAEAGEENAGLVDIGDGLACSFKIESHNHPSAIEPYQGAATGVGGINRDIFTMGARPVAQLNSLRFGDLNDAKTQWLVRGVVKGIGNYGNAFGVPTVGGEVYFDSCYQVNPLVNAFSAGIVETDKIASAISEGVGNPVFIVGSATGKDGIQGAAFASKDISEDSLNDLPSVQVGDPFQEKLLLEATLEVIASGAVVGIQDMGAAGIICSTSEMSAKGKHGMDIWLDKVPLRQENMLPFEILLSESQERMLIVVQKGREEEVLNIFDKWDLNCAQIGEVTDSQRLHFYQAGKLVADVPAHDLVLGGGAPVYHRAYREPAYFKEYQQFDPASVPQPDKLAEVARFLLSHPNIASRQWVSEQYDSMIGTNSLSTNEPSDAPVVRIKGTQKAIAIKADCNGRYVHADPEKGCAIAVAESARNVSCSGGLPVAITNCLNFGNPYNPEVYWQFVGAIQGMKKACKKFNTPVTGGNVSFYNQSADGGAVFPTPVIGMLGLLEDYDKKMSLHFRGEADLIYLVGKATDDLACSEYLYSYHKQKGSPAPYFDLDEEYAMQEQLRRLIADGLIRSAHDVSDGGLFVCLAEAAMAGGLGFAVKSAENIRKDAFWFGEGQGRVVVSVHSVQKEAFERSFEGLTVPYQQLGTVMQDGFAIDDEMWMSRAEAEKLYDATLPSFLNHH